jgi:hypothetical protein
MQLTFLGKETTGGQSPTLYATDQDTYVVRGWVVTDAALLAEAEYPDEETLVEVPARLMNYLSEDGLMEELTPGPPIVKVQPNGNYIVRGRHLRDQGALAQMNIPAHETCVEVPKAQMRKMFEGR